LAKLRTVLQNLGGTTFHGYGYDYWPRGGLRSVHDHLLTFASFAQVARTFRRPVFLSGPHRPTELDLNNQYDFGHYNPEFIDWVGTNVRFLLRQTRFIDATRDNFEAYLLGLTLLLYESYQVLAANPKARSLLRHHYEHAMRTGQARPQYYWGVSWAVGNDQWPAEIRSLMAILAERYDVNIVSSAIYFWLRREIDGTDRAIFSIIVDVLKAFCPAAYQNTNTFARWAAGIATADDPT
jgi:hypothetical protein